MEVGKAQSIPHPQLGFASLLTPTFKILATDPPPDDPSNILTIGTRYCLANLSAYICFPPTCPS